MTTATPRPASALISALGLRSATRSAASRRRCAGGVYSPTSRRVSATLVSRVRFAWEGKPGTGLGAKLGLTQTVGGSSSGGADALLSRSTMDGLAANPGSASPGSGSGAGGTGGAGSGNDELKSRRLELRFGYGLPAFGGRFTWTPEVGASLSDTGRDYSLGWRLVRGGSGEGGGSIEISFDARRSESANDDTQPVDEVGLRFTARF